MKTKHLLFYVIISMCLFFVMKIHAWFFDPGSVPLKRLYIYRINEFETLSSTDTNFDYGDQSPLIVQKYGNGLISPTNAFVCGWPVTVGVYIQGYTNSTPMNYTSAYLEYHTGTNATSNTNWVRFATITSNQFAASVDNPGMHFGMVTWTPPNVSNELYMIRIVGILDEYWSSGSVYATNITPKGDGSTWADWAVVGIKVIPRKRPGF